MKIKVLFPNEKGKIELSKEELEALLEECYRDGLEEGKQFANVYYSPYVAYTNDSMTLLNKKNSHADYWNNPSVTADTLEGTINGYSK